MTLFLSVPLKKSSEVEVDLVTPLSNLIWKMLSNTRAVEKVDYSEAVSEFNRLRQRAISQLLLEKNESSLEVVYEYYDQLCALETKFPKEDLRLPFKWCDAFDRKRIVTHGSIAFEKACVLFNIGALQSVIAVTQELDYDEGLKVAIKFYQLASGTFKTLKNISSTVTSSSSPDLSQDVIEVLSSLMVAQAQEIFVLKSQRSNVTQIGVAKLCCQCERLYAKLSRMMEKDPVKKYLDKEFIETVAAKRIAYYAMTQLFTSLDCRSRKKFGEEITRLQHAVELFKIAQKRSRNAFFFLLYANRAQQNLTESIKNNDLLYHDVIPDVKTLELPGATLLAKASTNSRLNEHHQRDLFADFMAFSLRQALVASERRRTDLVNAQISKLRQAAKAMNGLLSKLNLPEAIECLEVKSVVPDSLTKKSEELRGMGGVESLSCLMKELPESLKRNLAILQECERLLKEEHDLDDQLRSQFKERWTITPSTELNKRYLKTATKYLKIVKDAMKADLSVQTKYEMNREAMEILSKSNDELERSVVANGGSGKSSLVQKLRKLMEQVETMKVERDVIEWELKSAPVNVKDQADGSFDETALPQIAKDFQQSFRKQVKLMRDIKETHAQLIADNDIVRSSEDREKFLSDLECAFDMFMELQLNLKEGIDFYSRLTRVLMDLQIEISDFCFARKTEKEEFLMESA